MADQMKILINVLINVIKENTHKNVLINAIIKTYLTKNKKELYSYSIHNFNSNLSKKERAEWLSQINELDEETLFYEGDGDINFWAYTKGSYYIDTPDLEYKICDYSYQNLVIINGLIKVMEQVQKEV